MESPYFRPPVADRSSAGRERLLAHLFRQQLALQPGDPYLIQHSSARAIANHVRTFEWFLPHIPTHGAVLDWGCSYAPDSCLLSATFGDCLELHGCDFRQPDQYRAFHAFAGLSYKQLDQIVSLPYADDSFDVVIGSGTLEHVAMDYESLKEIYRILKLDGVLILSYLPNRLSVHEWLLRKTKHAHHRRLYGLREAEQLLKRSGLYPIRSRRQTFFYERLIQAGGMGRLQLGLTRVLCCVFPIQIIGATLAFVAKKMHSM